MIYYGLNGISLVSLSTDLISTVFYENSLEDFIIFFDLLKLIDWTMFFP